MGQYETELDRCLELRKTSLSSFVLAARKEIELLWQELMLSEEEMGEFGEFINGTYIMPSQNTPVRSSTADDYTEELLQAHEDEAERLRAEIESKAGMLPKVRDWHALKADEEELERNQNNPNRFSARGGAMLREEKLRKRVGILLPRVSYFQ
jgi:protein regulator of cytokinesis 1